MSEGPAKRRWFWFSLRAMLIFATMFAVLLGWFRYQLNWIRERQTYLETANKVSFAPHQPSWGLWLLGEEAVECLLIGPFADNPDPAYAKSLFPEAEIIDPSDDSDRY